MEKKVRSIPWIDDFKILKENVLAKKIEKKVLSIPQIDVLYSLKENVLAKKMKNVFDLTKHKKKAKVL